MNRLNTVTINFVGFKQEELQSKLKPININSTNFKDFLKKVGENSVNKLPPYSILQERGTLNFIIKTD
ncbi:hypothetical protein [Tenacibaculum halocynthiae]|uniref:hypothetical protein n=1 Tax=Tenacibaculum halocynthiae TaxID=1254437 RepID=UPI00389425AD